MATSHKLARIVHHLVRFGGEDIRQSEADFEKQFREQADKSLQKWARELGYMLAKAEPVPV